MNSIIMHDSMCILTLKKCIKAHTKPVLFFDIDRPYYFSILPIILHQIVTSVDTVLGEI